MEQPLELLKIRADEDWLVGCDSYQFTRLCKQIYQDITKQANREAPPKVLLAELDPVRFLASFIAAISAGCPIFLGNPHWVKEEWQQVLDLAQPDLILGKSCEILDAGNKQHLLPFSSASPSSLIMIPTGGSSGQIRFATHTWETLMASIAGFKQYFQQLSVNSFCVLPLYHVSGLMQFLRSFTTGGKLVIQPFKEVESGKRCQIDPSEFFISLVPTQLHRLLQNSETNEWLSRFHTVLLGGAPAWVELLETARYHRIRLAPTYGMTETASQIATLKPADFLVGDNGCGKVLPHAKITIHNTAGEILDANQIGIIRIQADSLALGYYPESFVNRQYFQGDDLGFLDGRGYINIVGRSSQKIITGGENVYPSEVEAAIQSTHLVSDVCVIGFSDLHWGQVVTAFYVPQHPEVSTAALQAAIEDKLSTFKRPKYWIPVEKLPRNPQGKVNLAQLQKLFNPQSS
ncbi:2-succinylbenzoate--CoA ligase [Microcoleus sp. FACHB-672]|uniref:2-succinylbenzoate--CoA ligase n=1 Tax=Microcoleus sp. FACHB-672 TaxID=2692825 RepID=UPI001684D470|nr:2-succinylbenzoate--CoA ligase [Microcoleus sp. FACHB-672]MBD2039575.1 2-succinylbenzoate--CoA ligase [Microcoleus sp. FACHB-672]